jgi:DNA (cytosine-5)-methyltransferase 1
LARTLGGVTEVLTNPADVVTSSGERFSLDGTELTKHLEVAGLSLRSSIELDRETSGDLKGDWWRAYLRGSQPSAQPVRDRTVRTVDLFSGPGGLANGVSQFFAEAGFRTTSELAADQDVEATRVYAANHGTLRTSSTSVASLVDFAVRRTTRTAEFQYPPELTDERLQSILTGVDAVFAGPPCQGHSNLNNHTRRDDPRNSLYLTVPAFAVAVGAPVVIIENVPAVLHDSTNVVKTAQCLFQNEGYQVATGVMSAAKLGWPQTRKRHFLVARRGAAPLPLEEVVSALGDPAPRPVWWAIHDLEDSPAADVVSESTVVSEENQARIEWLFENDAYELPLSERPKSHRAGTTYTAVYGRMRKDEPAPTITTGFMSPGRGRYVHPTRPRVLTAREAARLQGFPDTYRFVVDPASPPGRTALAKWIGDAVPMPLGFAAAVSAYASGLP